MERDDVAAAARAAATELGEQLRDRWGLLGLACREYRTALINAATAKDGEDDE